MKRKRKGKGEVKWPRVEVCIVHIIVTDAAHEHLSIEGIVPPNVMFIPCTYHDKLSFCSCSLSMHAFFHDGQRKFLS